MGYTIIIGESFIDNSDPEAVFETVEITEDSSAPVFPGDNATNSTNVRKPTYSDWENFLEEVDLYDLFLGEQGLMKQHPGIQQITEEDYKAINESYHILFALTDKLPGWESKTSSSMSQFDPNLARLAWLRFWFRWALENCENPSIYNG